MLQVSQDFSVERSNKYIPIWIGEWYYTGNLRANDLEPTLIRINTYETSDEFGKIDYGSAIFTLNPPSKKKNENKKNVGMLQDDKFTSIIIQLAFSTNPPPTRNIGSIGHIKRQCRMNNTSLFLSFR